MNLIKLLLAGLLLCAVGFAKEVTNESLSQLKAFKDIGATIKQHALIGKNLDLYLVQGTDGQGRPFSIVTDKNGDYLVLTNNVFDVKKQEAIKISANVALLKDKELLTFGNGKKIYYVFTDPECPYCQKFEAQWDKIKDKATLKILFFNLGFHKNANAMSRWILAAKTNDEKIKRLRSLSHHNKEYQTFNPSQEQKQALDKIIASSKKLGEKIGVQGTPAVYDEKGQSVNWSTLIK